MTTRSTPQAHQTVAYPPGTVVYDLAAQDIGRVADPEAYPHTCVDGSHTLVVPLTGSSPAWQAEPGALRTATRNEIDTALEEAAHR
ncbi:hypothetical protein [Streptomyces sp. NPDC057579]|uniref:hypothetical protein n=1 Tax=Streptomyces sp. NPDC057579 TaxID=3346172 RepID=UPI0036AD41C2